MKASIVEEEDITLDRFLSGLNLDIRDKVELLPFRDFNDLVQICIKIEQQQLLRNHLLKEIKLLYLLCQRRFQEGKG